jgi:triacylglycerol lipase
MRSKRMKAVLAWILSAAALAPPLGTQAQAPDNRENNARSSPGGDCVVLLHGLSRTRFSMRNIEETLEDHDYIVSNIEYDSRDSRIEELAVTAVEAGLAECRQQGADRIHFTTHSLGGILVRQYLSQYPINELGRVVMLAPPNHGSEIIDVFGRIPGFLFISGAPAAQLGTSTNDSIPLQLPPVNFELGVIAGDRSISPIFSLVIPDRDDGKVSVESARIEGMKDFIVMPYTHTFIMLRQQVIDQIVHFLNTGSFLHTAGDA